MMAMSAPAWADAYVGAQPPEVSGLTNGSRQAAHVLGQHFSRGASGPSWLAFTGMAVAILLIVAGLAVAVGFRLRVARRSQPA
jgi:hypothetical protein